LVGQGREQDCSKCHSEHNGEKFVPVRWDVDVADFDHRKAGYLLEGAHAGLACQKCHRPEFIAPAARKTIRVRDLWRTYLGLSQDCASCHGDAHAGRLGQDCRRCHTTSRWKDVGRFDHDKARFRLAGAHATTACQKCHRAEPIDGKQRIRYVGLEFAQCTPCHTDPHRGAFKAACQSCHNDAAWKPAVRLASAFDHSRTKFPLLGAHAGVACEKCHRTSDFTRAVAHEKCLDCHQDRHRGQFVARRDGGECGGCHRVEGWKPSTYGVAEHAASAYPLEARHAAVACAKCHSPAGVDTRYQAPHGRCVDCHQDAHGAQFASAPHGNRCEDCHSVRGFQPAIFDLAKHRATRFPLAGGHVAVPCLDCHTRRGPLAPVLYRFDDLSCAGCHRDPHLGQFRERMALRLPGGEAAGCEACHTAASWKDLERFDHSATRFELAGGHRAVACGSCHRPAALGSGLRTVVYRGATLECSGCHEDVHGGQFRSGAGTSDCRACHVPLHWRPSSLDHDRTAFPLSGAHSHVRCPECHKTTKEVKGRLVLFYKPTPIGCSNCHGPSLAEN
jgi:hypothetical protein